MVNLKGAEEVFMLRMGESAMTPDRRAENEVYLLQLPQFRGLQNGY